MHRKTATSSFMINKSIIYKLMELVNLIRNPIIRYKHGNYCKDYDFC